MSADAQKAFKNVKELLNQATTFVIMNKRDQLVLYTDASTKAIGGVLMQVDCKGVERPYVFVSHVLSDQATRWGIMELELYALVYCIKHLSSYLLGRQDHKNLLYSSNSTKLARWRIILSEYNFVIHHISLANLM